MSCGAWRWRRRLARQVGTSALPWAARPFRQCRCSRQANSMFACCMTQNMSRKHCAKRCRAAPNLLVVDHYQRDAVFERACRTFAQRVLVLDDATGRDHDCDILVDAAARSAESYAGYVPASARVLTGPAYALVRRSFLAHRSTALARRDGSPIKEILVSCGATDPDNVTAAVLDALDDLVDEIRSHCRSFVARAACRRGAQAIAQEGAIAARCARIWPN